MGHKIKKVRGDSPNISSFRYEINDPKQNKSVKYFYLGVYF